MSEGMVALVEDDPDLAAATTQLLTLAGYEVRGFAAAPPALDAIDADFPGVVVSDIRMPGLSGIELFRALAARDAALPVILVTGHADVETAVQALKAGAWDFLTKPFDPDILLGAVGRAMATRRLALENRRLRAAAGDTVANRLVGRSAAIERLRAMVPMLADVDMDVVVEGATGTGKELVARLIHRAGKRARHPFVVLDAAAPPVARIDDLFGAHGPIARGHRGTLFLDNLDRADAGLQHRLAQLAERRAVALDAREPEAVDLRLVAAIDDGARDAVLPALYHRLAAVTLRLPPLAERGEDVPLLVAHFLSTLAERHDRPAPPLADAAALLARREWPGTVRELELAVERLVLGLDLSSGTDATADAPLPERVRAFERAAIVEAVRAAGGEIARAIETLRVPRETFYYRVKRLGIDLARLRSGR